MRELVIRGGTVVTPEYVRKADVAVEAGLIQAIEPDLPGADEEINAAGLAVFPGVIDVHVHFNEPGHTDWEGAATGSRALAAGGGTLFCDMPLNSIPCTVNGREFDAKRKALEAASITDFAVWGGIVPGNLGEMAELAELGVMGFKAFLCHSGLAEFPRVDDLTLWEGLGEAARLGLPVAIHAENHELIESMAIEPVKCISERLMSHTVQQRHRMLSWNADRSQRRQAVTFAPALLMSCPSAYRFRSGQVSEHLSGLDGLRRNIPRRFLCTLSDGQSASHRESASTEPVQQDANRVDDDDWALLFPRQRVPEDAT